VKHDWTTIEELRCKNCGKLRDNGWITDSNPCVVTHLDHKWTIVDTARCKNCGIYYAGGTDCPGPKGEPGKPTLDLSKHMRTRDGREVRIYATDAGGAYPIHGSIAKPTSGEWQLGRWTGRGEYYSGLDTLDLVNMPRRIKRDVWINVFKDGSIFLHLTKPEGRIYEEPRIACVKVTIDCEEGEGM